MAQDMTNQDLTELTERNSQRLREYHEKVKTMSKEDLEQALVDLQEELVDEENEMKMIIGQTGVHMNATQAQAYRDEFNREIDFIKKKMDLVREAMA